MEIGAIIKRRRLAMKLTQEELADIMIQNDIDRLFGFEKK